MIFANSCAIKMIMEFLNFLKALLENSLIVKFLLINKEQHFLKLKDSMILNYFGNYYSRLEIIGDSFMCFLKKFSVISNKDFSRDFGLILIVSSLSKIIFCILFNKLLSIYALIIHFCILSIGIFFVNSDISWSLFVNNSVFFHFFRFKLSNSFYSNDEKQKD